MVENWRVGRLKNILLIDCFQNTKIEKRINEEIRINLRTKEPSQGGLLFVVFRQCRLVVVLS